MTSPCLSTRRPLQTGQRVGGKFEVHRIIGRGASATVYQAQHLQTGALVALKVVESAGPHEPHHLARFRREAQICARVRSHHVPQVYDVGRLPDGAPYLVMELLEGETLEERLGHGPLPLDLVIGVGKQLLAALEAVHAQGAIHRDVKPDNVVLATGDSGHLLVKLVDFGISRDIAAPQSLTMEGMILGTPHYMPPEQVVGGELDVRVDVYATGTVLYECITGRTPFQGATADEVMTAVQRDPVIPPALFREDCPSALGSLVMKALCREREGRFDSARQMREAIEVAQAAWHHHPESPDTAHLPATIEHFPLLERTREEGVSVRAPGPVSVGRWAAAVLGIVGVLGLAAGFLTTDREAPTTRLYPAAGTAETVDAVTGVADAPEAEGSTGTALAAIVAEAPVLASTGTDGVPGSMADLLGPTEEPTPMEHNEMGSSEAAAASARLDAVRERVRRAMLRARPEQAPSSDKAEPYDELPPALRDNPFERVAGTRPEGSRTPGSVP